MDCHLHITPASGSCKHITIAVHRSSDDALLGSIIATRAEWEEEISEYDTAKERIKAQIVGLVLANKAKTAAQLKTILEAAVIRV